jgi:hypothetical protein
MRVVRSVPLIALAFLCGCISQDQMRQERFVETRGGENIYRFWVYRDYQIKSWVKLLCPSGNGRELGREEGQTDLHFASGIPISNKRTYVTIACPVATTPAATTP